MSVKVENLPHSVSVSIDGDFDLPHIGEIRHALQQVLDSQDTINLDLQKVSHADVSCLQLFCSLHKTLDKNNKTITFSSNPPRLFTDLLARAGYYRHSACVDKLKGSCVLMEATHE
jgi:anti-anti-sigma regulatory factor